MAASSAQDAPMAGTSPRERPKLPRRTPVLDELRARYPHEGFRVAPSAPAEAEDETTGPAVTMPTTASDPGGRPYFEVLFVTPTAQAKWPTHVQQVRRLRRAQDAFVYEPVFVGSFDLPTIKPLVEQYLASLPTLKRTEAGRDVGIRPPASVVEKEVVKGRTPKSQVGVIFTGPFQNNQKNRVIFQAMANMLSGNLQRVLREDLGGTYGDPSLGEPIQYDELRIEHDAGVVEITVYNRAILLVMTDNEAIRRLHQVCCRLDDIIARSWR